MTLIERYIEVHPGGARAALRVIYNAVGPDGQRKLEESARKIIEESNQEETQPGGDS